MKLKDQFDFQMASLLWDLDHDTIPASISAYFTKVREMHSHETRQATSGKFRVNRVNTRYGKKYFQVQGSIALNKLKDSDLYILSPNKKIFLNKIKTSIIQSY